MDKYRVLCLHGYRQNGDKLRGRMAALRRAFKSSIEFGACKVSNGLQGVHHLTGNARADRCAWRCL